MAKTRRKKINKSPGKAFRNARTYVAEKGEMVTVKGIRGRTKVIRLGGGKSVRSVESAVQQVVAKPVGDRKPKAIFVGRQYTGVARSKPYPYRSIKRGAVPTPVPAGLMGGLAKAVRRVKKVIVGGDNAV